MAINVKKPAIKETVGAQYTCFNIMSTEGNWTENFEEDVEKTSVVKSVKVTSNGESTDVYASGEVYDTDSFTSRKDIEVEVVAFPADTIAKMKGDKIDTKGLVLSGGNRQKPFFAYGKVVRKKHGHEKWEWYPKCMLAEVSDEVGTKEEKYSEQTDTITIRAYAFNDEGDFVAYVDTETENFPEGLKEDKFFAAPIINAEGLETAVTGTE